MSNNDNSAAAAAMLIGCWVVSMGVIFLAAVIAWAITVAG
jgi:hypothetical protein